MKNNSIIGKILYGGLFTIIIPLFLVWWSQAVISPFPAIESSFLGISFIVTGLLIMMIAIITLKIIGKGLPMNAFPPKKLVTIGIYKLLPHPIYVGFVFICFGLSLYFGHASGLWLTTPIVAMVCFALVYGYERHYLLKQFRELPKPWLHINNLLKPLNKLCSFDKLWQTLLKATEKIANSWQEKRIGPLRIISHGLYGGIAVGVGVFAQVLLCGQKHLLSICIIFIAGIIGAALWAQLLEGSSKLLRPFGYYGAVIGIISGGGILYLFGKDVYLILAAWGCTGSFVQAIGRVRCLIQGCCHGKEAPYQQGIRISNEHSRVCSIANLKNRSIYPSQVYSIIGNILAGIILVGLWLIAAPLSIILGGYFLLAGIVRFVEESYRGEPQTKIISGLPVYQWLSILSIVAGMLIMLIPSTNATVINWDSLTFAAITGIVCFALCWFICGIDFPDSNVRFSRLTD